MPYLNGRIVSQKFFTSGLKGPKGNQGVQGSKGDVGDKGSTGSQGETGLQGVTGLQGYTGAPGLGVPSGGFSGQLLVKSSDTDYDTEWKDDNYVTLDTAQGITGTKSFYQDTSFYGVQFDTTRDNNVDTEGNLHWDTDDRTISLGLGNNVILQVGQENYIYARNQTGSTIGNGKAVYINGSSGGEGRPTIALADSDLVHESSFTVGLATEQINNNASGLVTSFGLVRGLDTSSYSPGTLLYLSDTDGEVTDVMPGKSKRVVLIGVVVVQDSSDGSIFVDVRKHDSLFTLSDVETPVYPNIPNIGDILIAGYSGIWYNSSTGYIGTTGPQGETGLTGYGITGLKGETGPLGAGYTGLPGPTGIQGPQGETGAGIQGETGLQGGQGLTGSLGNQGETGPIGITGAQGIDGVDGLNGYDGETGLRGVTGYQGEQGETGSGIQGSTGIQGIQGVTGISGGSGGPYITLTSQLSVSNTTTETTVLTTSASTGYLSAGTQLKFKFFGLLSYQGNNGDFTIRLYVGTNAGQTIVLAQDNSSTTSSYCKFEGVATIRTEGSSGSFITSGDISIQRTSETIWHGGQGGSTTTTVDTTATSPEVKMTVQWGTANANNTIIIENASICTVI